MLRLKQPAPEPKPDLHELADEVAELGEDVCHGLQMLEARGGIVPELEASVTAALAAVRDQLATIDEQVDRATPRKLVPPQPGRHPRHGGLHAPRLTQPGFATTHPAG